MRGNAQRHADNRMSQQQARTSLAIFLASATDEKIAELTVEKLVASYRVPAREAECALLAQQGKRERQRLAGQP